jgi:hypothetical protein
MTHAYYTKRGIRIGDSMTKVRLRYGQPDGEGPGFAADSDQTGEDIQYEYLEHRKARSICFYFARGRVRRIAMGWFNP